MLLCLQTLSIKLFPTAIHLGDTVITRSAVLSGRYNVAIVTSVLMVFNKRTEIVGKIALVLRSPGCKT